MHVPAWFDPHDRSGKSNRKGKGDRLANLNFHNFRRRPCRTNVNAARAATERGCSDTAATRLGVAGVREQPTA
jgi:hypothetical protein